MRFLILLGVASLPALLLLAFCAGPPWYYSDKYSPSGSSARPSALPQALIPERQTEPHTCGLHTLSSIYRAYGLEATAHNLRFRLGTDKPFTNFIPDSTGSIHPDMVRVLRQDGFRAELLRPSSTDAAQRLTEHLRQGHVAAALVKVNEFHWVALSAAAAGQVQVCDSLQDLPYARDLRPFVETSYSLLLISPAGR